MKVAILHRRAVYPPQNGEAVRVSNVVDALRDEEVHLFSTDTTAPEHVTQHTIGRLGLNLKPLQIHLYWLSYLHSAGRAYRRLFAASLDRALGSVDEEFDLVVSQFPQVYGLARRMADRHDAKLVVEKHNAWFDLVSQHFDQRGVPADVRDRISVNLAGEEVELLAAADGVVFHSEADRKRYKIPEGTPCRVIPNGTDIGGERVDDNRVEAVAEHHDLDPGTFTCVFLGSYDYQPNREAARFIDRNLAPTFPDVAFLLVGRNPPEGLAENVHLLGFVDDLPAVLELADIALCPLNSGSGTKLKMLDYLAAGLPVVTTKMGASGLNLEEGTSALICDRAEFEEAVAELRAAPELRKRISAEGHELAGRYDWRTLMESYKELVDELR